MLPIYSHIDVLVVYFSQQGNDNFLCASMGARGEAAAEETAEIEAGDATPGPDRTSWNSRTAPQFPISQIKKTL